MKKHSGNILCIGVAIGLLIYAIPKLDMNSGFSPPTIFAVSWVVMMLFIIAAHSHHVLGVDEETRNRLAQVKQHKRERMEQFLTRKAR